MSDKREWAQFLPNPRFVKAVKDEILWINRERKQRCREAKIKPGKGLSLTKFSLMLNENYERIFRKMVTGEDRPSYNFIRKVVYTLPTTRDRFEIAQRLISATALDTGRIPSIEIDPKDPQCLERLPLLARDVAIEMTASKQETSDV